MGMDILPRGGTAGMRTAARRTRRIARALGRRIWSWVWTTTTFYVFMIAVFATFGVSTIPGAGFWTGGGRVGLLLPANARVDDFKAQTLP